MNNNQNNSENNNNSFNQFQTNTGTNNSFNQFQTNLENNNNSLNQFQTNTETNNANLNQFQTNSENNNNLNQFKNENHNLNSNTSNVQNNFNQNIPNNNYINNIDLQPENKKKKKTIKIVIISIVIIIAIYFIIRLILTILAVSNTINHLDETRKDTFVSTAESMISSTELTYMLKNYEDEQCFSLNSINQELEKPATKSPFGTNFSSSSYIKIKSENMNNIVNICLVDEEGIGISYTSKENLTIDSVTTNVTCVLPPECN